MGVFVEMFKASAILLICYLAYAECGFTDYKVQIHTADNPSWSKTSHPIAVTNIAVQQTAILSSAVTVPSTSSDGLTTAGAHADFTVKVLSLTQACVELKIGGTATDAYIVDKVVLIPVIGGVDQSGIEIKAEPDGKCLSKDTRDCKLKQGTGSTRTYTGITDALKLCTVY